MDNIDAESVVSTIETMRRHEETGYKVYDYLHQQAPLWSPISTYGTLCPLSVDATQVDIDCRFRMAEWCYQIVDFCKFKRETVFIAMSCLDRYLCSNVGRSCLNDRNKFQLVVMTALYTCIKIHEPEAMEPSLIASLSRGAYTKQQVETMEFELLNAIQWRVNPPTAMAFVYYFLDLVPSNMISNDAKGVALDLAKFQTEVAVTDYDLTTVNASSVALASLSNAFESMDMDPNILLYIQTFLSQTGQIDVQSLLFRDIRIRLYEAITHQPRSGQLLSNLIPETCCTNDYTKTQMSVHGSPRSVTTSI